MNITDMAGDQTVFEGYGDPHLHYEEYPEYQGAQSAGCKWNAENQSPYDQYVPEAPLYPQRCHVEYCHPGTWQGTDKDQLPSLPIMSIEGEAEAPVQGMGFLPFNNLPTVGMVILVIALLYFFRKRLNRLNIFK